MFLLDIFLYCVIIDIEIKERIFRDDRLVILKMNIV